ncbi:MULTISPECIES: helix-turn-helix domain-containing protein [Halomonadaceae]|uniref:HTH-type transcriptional regulator SinR n=1 Tax=Vreelandella titanicae TaxID=664683 RepID=A0AAP9T1B0_9GAMM|nr:MULTISPECIES: helix-turn-helix domain-containing protein [Halomonas]QKS25639.1 HTH-type transcriptional regulator SinR [Halomonas titanicae]CDG53164.1 Helix-turn-helix domain-containing protein [Halomonas sp. A3H3]|eukprot:TRINITY_DN38339_c0_g1_i1.p1 TRINITY_DN38339_c0_g1~~TRINITY_DN38339_c0_g1_i1.p1  ORF type:complete len:201 (+),score=2.28 TRINITY_DN38339_c0_g1_i1:14-616(+)
MTNKVNITTDPDIDAQSISQAVANKLKAYRKVQKLSLDELSRRAGISKGMLVEMEKGLANPSIAILCKVAAALGISVADIVNVTSPPAVHVIDNKDIPTLWTGPKGGTARLLAGTSGPNMIEMWRWEMQPKELFNAHSHPNGTHELFHVEQGELRLKVADTDVIVPAGSSAVARTDVPHMYANDGESKLVFMMAVVELHQ